MNIESLKVKQKGEFLIVKLKDNLSIGIKEDFVDDISDKVPNVDKNKIAILLAIIENTRIDVMSHKREDFFKQRRIYTNIPDSNVKECVAILLEYFDVLKLCNIFSKLQYHQIRQIFMDRYPVKRVKEHAI